MSQYFPKPFKHFGGNIHVEVDLFNYSAKLDIQKPPSNKTSRRRRGDVVTTSPCTSQWRHRYVSNETPNDLSVERCQDVSVVRLHYLLLERRDDVLRGHSNKVPPVRLHDI